MAVTKCLRKQFKARRILSFQRLQSLLLPWQSIVAVWWCGGGGSVWWWCAMCGGCGYGGGGGDSVVVWWCVVMAVVVAAGKAETIRKGSGTKLTS